MCKANRAASRLLRIFSQLSSHQDVASLTFRDRYNSQKLAAWWFYMVHRVASRGFEKFELLSCRSDEVSSTVAMVKNSQKPARSSIDCTKGLWSDDCKIDYVLALGMTMCWPRIGHYLHVLRLQHAATHCITLQHIWHHFRRIATATLCNTLQHSAAHCNTLQHTATYTIELTYDIFVFCTGPGSWHHFRRARYVAECCSVLRCVVVCCSVCCSGITFDEPGV